MKKEDMSLMAHFGNLSDPRVERTRLHPLMNILTITICGVICGADTWVDIANYGEAKRSWLGGFLDLTNGIPSHDTLGRVFARLDPEELQACFQSWIQEIQALTAGEVVAIDGKQLRRSHDRSNEKAAIHMVSAWASANQLVLGQVKVDDKSNEKTAIPELLNLLELSGCIVTIDAMGTQESIAEMIMDQKADYVLALKQNQGHLYEAVDTLFEDARQVEFDYLTYDYHQTVDGGHGRIEIRRYWVTSDIDWLPEVTLKPLWAGLRSIGMVEAERRLGEQVTLQKRYFLTSLPADASLFARAVRGHWGIENSVHWILDVAFREDDSRIRTSHAPQNLATIRHLALNLLRHERSAKCGIKAKRLKAAWDDNYLLKVLAI